MNKIQQILDDVRFLAVVGISDKPEKAGYYVSAYMKEQGYDITGVSPVLSEALGRKAYPTLQEVPDRIDMVVLFRRSEDIPAHLDDILAVHPKVVWMQLGIRNEEVARRLESEGICVIQDRCLMVEHQGNRS